MLAIIGPDYLKKVLPLIENAQRSVRIIIYYWRLYPKRPTSPVMLFTRALHRAALRGVSVRVLCSHDGLIQQLRGFGFEAKRVYAGKLLHAKLLLIDDEVAILGSHNFTQSAFSQNIEISAAIVSSELCRDFSTYFDNLWGL